MSQHIHTLVVVGVGLIGGSFALSLKRAGKVQRVIGVGRSQKNLQQALELGVVDEISQDLAQATSQADFILLAAPVGQMGGVMAQIAPHLPAHTIISDAGSTKADVATLYRQHLPAALTRCVPAHPIAGSDLSGANAAQYGLYQNRKVVLTPLAENSPAALALVSALWQSCGAQIHQMSAAEHDELFATVSHLPHLLAYAYVDMVANKPDAERCFDFAATGFRDFTRIAGSHPEMWTDITLANREALLAELARYQQTLAQLQNWLQNSDADNIASLFTHAQQARHTWYQKFLLKA